MTDAAEARIVRLEGAVMTLASWLVQAQTGFGKRDAEGIIDIVDRSRARFPLNGDDYFNQTTEETQ